MLISQSNTEQNDPLDAAHLGLDLPAAAASAIAGIGRKFANQRHWGEFLAALQCSVNYAAVVGTLRSGKKWLNYRLSR